MDGDEPFVDYYDLLQVTPGCDARILEVAYRYFAKLYHPDHTDTADIDKFSAIVAAYKVLGDPEKRAAYDKVHATCASKEATYSLNGGMEVDEEAALGDAAIHQKILYSLYKRRRSHPGEPGLGGWLLQELLECSDEEFEFHSWYLKSKGYVQATEQGTIAITIDGVDHIISSSKTAQVEKLLLPRTQDDAE